MIDKKSQNSQTLTVEKRKLELEISELKDNIDIKERKISVLQRKVGSTVFTHRCKHLTHSALICHILHGKSEKIFISLLPLFVQILKVPESPCVRY